MEGKAMRVVVKTIMPFLLIALVSGQATIPGGGLPLPAPAIPGTGGGGQVPPEDAGFLPPGGVVPFPPTLPGEGMFPPVLPFPFPIDGGLPGFGNLDKPKRTCIEPCVRKCRLKRSRSRLLVSLCSKACYLRCGIRISDEVLSCTSHCANSVSPASISGERRNSSSNNSNEDSRMRGFRPGLRAMVLVIGVIWLGVAAMYGLLKPIANNCIMTYMYPTYIPISTTEGVSSAKYGLYLYHEVHKFLYILQVRSLAAESDRAYQGGPLERTFYREAYLATEEGGSGDTADFRLPNQYTNKLDWFAVDLEGEHSAMDGRILEEHTEYVVYAIHRILDQYKESRDARQREGAATTGGLPRSVILVGHSMGGFVARAATIHPHLRKSAVETILTLSSPHQLPPLPLQPSLGHYYESINHEWRKGYEVQTARTGHYVSGPKLSHVVVVSICGGYNDYQVRSKLESLDGIVPPTHGFMISSTSMKNVWLSMEHQAILWCNQLVVQVSHTLLSLIDPRTGQPFSDPRQRLATFTRMLHSGIPQSFNWKMQSQSPWSTIGAVKDVKDTAGSQVQTSSDCPSSFHWSDDVLERDLYIQATTVTVLAMDGRRRWLDIEKLGSNGKSHFIFVTNLAPCSGVRIHLWPHKGKLASDLPAGKRVVEVTSKMVQIPAGPAPRQIEPGSQTEQAPPSAVLYLGPEEMHGFRFLTVSVAPSPTISGRPPPATSMAVGQFFNPDEGEIELSPISMLLSIRSHKDVILKEDHPLALNLSFAISLGLLPSTFSLKTTGCGIKDSGLLDGAGDAENTKLCKLRCFPPVALAWDPTSGLHVFPNLYSETLVVDSSPALWTSTGAEKTTVLLLLDPHCSYKASSAVSVTTAASRFLLLYNSQIIGFSVAVIFFALMRQAHARPVPSILQAVDSNLRMPFPFLLFSVVPISISLFFSFLTSHPFPPLPSFTIVSMICYLFANGFIILLILVSQLLFYVAAYLHVLIKRRWKLWEGNSCFLFLQRIINLSSSFFSLKVVRVLRANPLLLPISAAIVLSTFVHPALGLSILLLFHAYCCHSSLCNAMTASFRSHAQEKDSGYKSAGDYLSHQSSSKPGSPSKENSSSYSQTQEDTFHHRHGLLTLHLLATLMFGPSLVSWLQFGIIVKSLTALSTHSGAGTETGFHLPNRRDIFLSLRYGPERHALEEDGIGIDTKNFI
ncbi:GPI inositol-deacylase PGAP1-like protein [Corchorus olitorius]|uniref:GPI inositol-deacylase n=1 Tax=Corchorus olitorius TaxID=93759 RepID=A0A1R3HFE5_9ROSI|nr:GPI inositol-deacylase PGAP1-like protein [Corchorus olitorius]